MAHLSDSVAVQRARYFTDGLAARFVVSDILRLSSEHVALWYSIRTGLTIANKTGHVSLPMVSRVLRVSKDRSQELLEDLRAVIIDTCGSQ